jgi:hypothetical protein
MAVSEFALGGVAAGGLTGHAGLDQGGRLRHGPLLRRVVVRGDLLIAGGRYHRYTGVVDLIA